MSEIAIVSAGAFGTALANILAETNHHIRLHVRETDTYEVIKGSKINATYLPGVPLHMQKIYPTMELAEVVRGAEFVLLTVPAQHIKQTIGDLKLYIESKTVVILTSKGLVEKGRQISEIVAEYLPENKVCGIYGIMFARLIASSNAFSSMCIASTDENVAKTVATLFRHHNLNKNKFCIYLSNDLRGAEFGGAMKNVYAIAVGIFDEYCEVELMNLSEQERFWAETSRHSLLDLCMMEFIKFGLAYGARIHTLIGPSGIGDIQACTTQASRNYQYGRWIASLELRNRPERAPELHEGYDTVRAAMELSHKYSLNLPILKAIYGILFKSKTIKDTIPSLLGTLDVDVTVAEEKKFNNAIISSIQSLTRIPAPPKERKRKIAFISYRFSPEAERYMKIISSICEFKDIAVSTGVAKGLQPPGIKVPDVVLKKIKEADLYIAIFLNDKSDSTWLIEEIVIAVSKNKSILVFVEQGTPSKKTGKMTKGHPYHFFAKESFPEMVIEQLNLITKETEEGEN